MARRRRRGGRPKDSYQLAAKRLREIKRHASAIVKLSEDLVGGMQDTVIRSVVERIALFEKSFPDLVERSAPLLDRGARLLGRISKQVRAIETKAASTVKRAKRRRRAGRGRNPVPPKGESAPAA